MPCSSPGSSPILSSDSCYSLESQGMEQGGQSPAGRSTQPELSCYHPDALLWFCFVSCSQSVKEVMAACGNTRPPSKGGCHLSVHCSLCWSSSSLHHPSHAWRSRNLHWHPCVLQGRCEEYTTNQKVPYQRLEPHPVVLLSPEQQELVPSL